MSIGLVGNSIYVNQQTATVASAVNTHNAKVELQAVMAQAIMDERDEKIVEVRPTEENQEINPDAEHEKQTADEQIKKRKKNQKESATEDVEPLHILDIKV